MKQDLLASLRAAVVALVAFTALTGVVYPALIMGIGKAVFPHQAKGSLIEDRGRVVGSELLGQAFTDPAYVWSRPSAIGSFPYDAMSSTGSNLAETNPALHDAVADRIKVLRAADPENLAPVPADLVTSSGSGLDPHITPAAAYYQAARVARARKLAIADVRAIIADHVEARTFGILGEPRINVVALNRALDARSGRTR